MPLPTFDGSSQISSNTCVYLQLNPMVEEDALKMAILHLEGDSNKWWFHGLKNLGHDQVITYGEFIDMVLEIFEQNDPELSFKELAHLKQVGTLTDYMMEFKKLSVKVADVSMGSLVFLFTDGLDEPLKYLFKSHKPTTLKYEMSLTRDLRNVLPRTKFPPKPNSKYEKKTW